ncbi:hypothetical protein TSUD_175310 [Trifolium subterraneum]|uniref:Retrotransposon gag domain-containing protein n=1 Tax=Trifolium subterraneum TaxID=3900 RepID=A0A2Z6LHQ1_TRISU|nr:hypothetical protein TSUD_175310 [Trifolium subterraneum]
MVKQGKRNNKSNKESNKRDLLFLFLLISPIAEEIMAGIPQPQPKPDDGGGIRPCHYSPRRLAHLARPPRGARPTEMKIGLLQLLYANPFTGLPHKDPYNHLVKFYEIAGLLDATEAEEESLFVRMFPHSLLGTTKDWYLDQPTQTMTNWNTLEEKSLDRFFPHHKFMEAKTSITMFAQGSNENLCEAWDRYKSMWRKCPNHGFDELTQIHIFCNGILEQSKLLLDATAGGSLLSLSAADATTIIEKMALNDRQSERNRLTAQKKPDILELDTSDVMLAQNKLLTNTIEELSKQMSKLISIQEGQSKAKQVAYCQLCTGDHPTGHCPPNDEEQNQQHQKNIDVMMRSFETQLGQIAKQVANNNNQGGSFTANTETNPKEQCKSITTRSGKEIGKGIGDNLQTEEAVVERREKFEEEVEESENERVRDNKKKQQSPPVQNLPYPHAPTKKDKERQYARFLDIFNRLQINIPFSEALEQMPTYAKFMKEILTKKRKFTDEETIHLDASCSAIIQRTLPQKEKDPGRVTLPVTIGNASLGKALIADKFFTRPSGIAEDVLVKVDKFMFPIDFVVMDIEEDEDVPLILGRPFMKTAHMMIDIDDRMMKRRVQDEEVSFNLWETMKNSKDKGVCFKMDATEDVFLDLKKQLHKPSSLKQALTNAFNELDPDKDQEIEDFQKKLDELKEVSPLEATLEELKDEPKTVEVKPELRTLPSHLKYVFLEEDSNKLVIISSSLSTYEENSLIKVLKANKEAIGWVLSNLKGINPSYCMHNIMMEEDYKPVAQ